MKLNINRSFLAVLLTGLATSVFAHVDWTQLNHPDANGYKQYAIYHLDESGSLANGALIQREGTLPADVGVGNNFQLIVANGVGGTVTSSSDIFDVGILGNPGSLIFSGPTAADEPSGAGVQAPNYNSGTFDFWFKWDVPLTAPQEVRVGTRSAAKILIKRDPITPANDRFGLLFSHNDYVPAPGWINGTTTWNDFSAEAATGDWIHVGVAVSSTGTETTSPNAIALAHELYQSGSKAWIYLNGHKFGISPNDYVDLFSNADVVGDAPGDAAYVPRPRPVRAHNATRFQISNITGTIKIDELSFWTFDLTNQGTIAGTNQYVFGDGRQFPAGVADWTAY